MMHRLTVVLLAFTWNVVDGAQIRLDASKDNTLYEHSSGRLGNGSGSFLFAGRTGQANRSIRRTLLHFDLSVLPPGASLTSVELALTSSKTASPQPVEVTLHRMLHDWAEGETNAFEVNVEEGRGDDARDGDATWIHSAKPNELWGTPGGDFVLEPTSAAIAPGEGLLRWNDDAILDDLNFWLAHPDQNFGWAILGDESRVRTAQRFHARSHPDLTTRPQLILQFEENELLADCNGDGVTDFADVDCACVGGTDSLEAVLNAAGLLVGDLDGDGAVGFADFLVLSDRFGGQGSYTEGDVDCDGEVGFSDFLLLSAHFGRQSTAAAQVVPEPAASVLFLLFGSGLMMLRNRGKNGLCDARCCH